MARRDLTFRVFVSSTFSDFVAERNALQEKVFPKLSDYCRRRGARFLAIDLRWGVGREAALDQQTMNICLSEIQRCGQLSPKANFIALLGNRYGWVPLPDQIDAVEFESFAQYLTPDQWQFLCGDAPIPTWRDGGQGGRRGWYRKDENAVPAVYVLQPRTIEYPEQSMDEDCRRINREELEDWQGIETRLRGFLQEALHKAGWPERDPRLRKYKLSSTHREISAGILTPAFTKGVSDHALCYCREIDGLPDDQSAATYRDFKGHERDADAENSLIQLKNELKRVLPDHHFRCYHSKWQPSRGKPEGHLEALCADVEADLRRLIDGEMADFERCTQLEREVTAHREYAAKQAGPFMGRRDIMETMDDYIQTGIQKGRPRPLVISGPSGSGKTALLAKSYNDLRLQNKARVMARFIGATPDSSDLQSLLKGLCLEMNENTGRRDDVPQELAELVAAFANGLRGVPAERPLVIYMDALDQISVPENAHTLYWLPRELPPHVRLVVSVMKPESMNRGSKGPGRLPNSRDGGTCFQVARKLFSENLIELGPLSVPEGEQLLDSWQAEAGRTLQPDQRKTVMERFMRCPYPLYLKLAFQEVRRWKSYDGVPRLRGGMPDILTDLFERLEGPRNHGYLLTSRSLGYIAAARRGLSEDELLNVLSADPEVMADFQRRSPDSPHVNRLPMVIWSQLLVDIEAYVTQHRRHGSLLLTFYHRQVAGAVAGRYLKDTDKRRAHRRLAAFFNGQDSWLEPPLQQCPPETRPRRRVIGTPANSRKIEELPWHERWAHMTNNLSLCDLTFIEAKFAAGMGRQLLEDYRLWEAHEAQDESLRPGNECGDLSQYADFVKQEFALLELEPGITFQQAANRTGDSAPKGAARKRWLSGVEKRRWIQLTTAQKQRGRGLAFQVTGDDVAAASVQPDQTRVVVVSYGGRLIQANPGTGQIEWERETPLSTILCCGYVDGQRILFGAADGSVLLMDAQSGHILDTVSGHGAAVMAVAINPLSSEAATVGADGSACLWTVAANALAPPTTLIHTHEPLQSAAFLHHGNVLAIGTASGELKLLERRRQWREGYREPHHSDTVSVIASAPNSSYFWTGALNGTVRCLRLKSTRATASGGQDTVGGVGGLVVDDVARSELGQAVFQLLPTADTTALVGMMSGETFLLSRASHRVEKIHQTDNAVRCISMTAYGDGIVIDAGGRVDHFTIPVPQQRHKRGGILDFEPSQLRLSHDANRMVAVAVTGTQRGQMFIQDKFQMAVLSKSDMSPAAKKVLKDFGYSDDAGVALSNSPSALLVPYTTSGEEHEVHLFQTDDLSLVGKLKLDEELIGIITHPNEPIALTVEGYQYVKIAAWDLNRCLRLWKRDVDISDQDDLLLSLRILPEEGVCVWNGYWGERKLRLDSGDPPPDQLPRDKAAGFAIRFRKEMMYFSPERPTGTHVLTVPRGQICWFRVDERDGNSAYVETNDGNIRKIHWDGTVCWSRAGLSGRSAILHPEGILAHSPDGWFYVFDTTSGETKMQVKFPSPIASVAVDSRWPEVGVVLDPGEIRLCKLMKWGERLHDK